MNMLDNQNKDTLATIAAGLSIIHIWLALAYGWYLVLITGFFGVGLGGWIIAGLVALLLLSPPLSWMIIRYGLRPLIHNMLEVRIISGSGCIGGLVIFLCEVIYIIWAVTRDLTSAFWVFLSMPLAALIFALIVTLLGRIRWPHR